MRAILLNIVMGLSVATLGVGAHAAVVAACPFDNEFTTLDREGLIYLRYALGFNGSALVAGTTYGSQHATAAVEAITCATCAPQIDVNGDNQFDLTDAQIIARYLAGLRGAALTRGVALGAGTRNTPALVNTFIADGCPTATSAIVLAAGDIAYCPAEPSLSGGAATAAVLRRVPGAPVLTLGDNAYSSGTAAEFSTCFAPTWGVELPRLRPAPGNHDYVTANAAGYFGYFGRNAGATTRGYYSFDVGAWHVVSLNSNVNAAAGSVQEQWLRQDLASTARKCVLAYWHHPVFTSSPRGYNPTMLDIWKALADYKVDVVLNGHEHNYERFAKQTPAGVLAADGIRQFIVGSGGVGHTASVGLLPNSEVFNALTYGVLKLTLNANSYAWEFLPELTGVTVDSGTATCNRQ